MEFERFHSNFSFVYNDLVDKVVAKLELLPYTGHGFLSKRGPYRVHLNQLFCTVIFEEKRDLY